MTDSILIQNGAAHQIWRGVEKAALPPMHADLIAQVVEAPGNTVNEGDLWNGSAFTPKPIPTPSPIIDYGRFRAALTDAEKQAVHSARAASWQIDDFVGLAQAQGNINIASTDGLAAKAALVAANVLTQDRADILFNPGTW